MSSFSVGGLLSDKLLRISSWMTAESDADKHWQELSSDGREKLSAHYCILLSKLFEIFLRWSKHPDSNPKNFIRYSFIGYPTLRNDAFVLPNSTKSAKNRQEQLHADLKDWQNDFDKGFAPGELPALAANWPATFPTVLYPDQASSQQKLPSRDQPKHARADTAPTHNRPGNTSSGNQNKQHQHKDNESQMKGKDDSGEYLIAQKPAYRLKTEYKGTIGAPFRFGKFLRDAKQSDPTFPDPPKINQKQFCLRFLTSKCGCCCKSKKTGKTFECNMFHLDLMPNGNANQVPADVFDQLIVLARTAPLSDKIEPSPELLAKGSHS